jgi:hypothetical protein
LSVTADDYISVRDRRHKPPQRLRPTKKLHIHWCWMKCGRCPHMRGRNRPIHHPSEAGRLAGHVAPARPLHRVRHQGRGVTTSELGGSDTGWAQMPISEMASVPDE